MSSKKSKKPDQEIYRPPKSDRQTNYENNGDKSHERTFYNSNHKKKPPPSKSADNSSSNNKDLEKSKKSIDEKYESDYGYYKQSAAAAGVYPTRHWKYRTDNCYSGEQKWNTNPIDNNHYWNNRYKNEEENYYYEYCYGNEYEDEYEGYGGGGRQGGGRYRGVQATAGGQRGNYERSGDARRGRASFGAGKKAVGDSGTGAGGGREKKEGKAGKQAGGYGDKKRHHNHHQRQPYHQQQHQQSQQSHEIAGILMDRCGAISPDGSRPADPKGGATS